MTEWCMEHPWLTFILLFILFDSIRIRIRWNPGCKRCEKKEEGKKDG